MAINPSQSWRRGPLSHFSVGTASSSKTSIRSRELKEHYAGQRLLSCQPCRLSKFAVDDYIYITCLSMQDGGFPMNLHNGEFRKITGIVGTVLSFADPLKETYFTRLPSCRGSSAATPTLAARQPSTGCRWV